MPSKKQEKTTVSTAVWCTLKDVRLTPPIELHVNYWKIGNKKNPRTDLLDIGVMIQNEKNTDSVSLFIPFKIQNGSIKDLSHTFKQIEVVQGIFNERLSSVSSDHGTPHYQLQYKKNRELFCDILKLSTDQDEQNLKSNIIESTDLNNGTLLKLKLTDVSKQRNASSEEGKDSEQISPKLYFRIRINIPNGKDNPFIQSIEPKDKIFASAFTSQEILDFRLNEVRTMPNDVLDKFSESIQNVQSCKLVAFLIAIPIDTEIALTTPDWHKFRILENSDWDNYLDNTVKTRMAVYHWKSPLPNSSNDKIDEFSAHVKFQKRHTNVWHMLIYVLIIIVLSALGSKLSDAGSYAKSAIIDMYNGDSSHQDSSEGQHTAPKQQENNVSN